jgi:uncharacterized UBP type Zn finger protein
LPGLCRICWIEATLKEGDVVSITCSHLDQIQDVTPSADGCEDCLKLGDTWLHLRLCLTCGHVGCCDSSKNKHATAHFHETGHPIVRSFEPGEDWAWCYVDRIMLQPS